MMNALIRLAAPADAAAIQAIYGPIVRDTHISFEYTVPPQTEMAERVERTLEQHPWIICDIAGDMAGYAYASAFRSRRAYQWSAETTVYVDERFQGRGVAKALYLSLMAVLRAQGYCSAVGVIALPNLASVRAHESLGFRKIGVFHNVGFKAGAWRDTGWWQLDLRAPPCPPEPPMPIGQLAQDPNFERLLATGLSAIKPQKRGAQ